MAFDPWFIRQAALAAMQGILANSLSPNEDKAAIAKEATQAAEALAAELDAKYPLPEMPQGPVAEPTQVIEPPPAESETVSAPGEAAPAEPASENALAPEETPQAAV